MRNLSISSSSCPTSSNSFLVGKLDHHEFGLNPLRARQNTSLVKEIVNNYPIWRRKEIFELPLTNKIIENPTLIQKVIEDISKIENTVNLPDANKIDDENGKQAKNGMIMIRHRKMKKHKLRKLRKKMKFEWAKVTNIDEKINKKILITFCYSSRFVSDVNGARRKPSKQSSPQKSKKPRDSPLNNTSLRKFVSPGSSIV